VLQSANPSPSGDRPAKQNRSALLHIRVVPELRDRIENEARLLNIAPSALARKILATHYEGR